MTNNIHKTFQELGLEASRQTGYQEVGETVEPLMDQLEKIIEDCVQKQYEKCQEKGFSLPKYYIHIMITKDLAASNLFGAPNMIRIRKPHCRVTRPSPYQDQDHYLWSVTNMNKVNFEWCIPNKENMSYILKNPQEFDVNYVRMLRKYALDKLENISDYMVGDKVI